MSEYIGFVNSIAVPLLAFMSILNSVCIFMLARKGRRTN